VPGLSSRRWPRVRAALAVVSVVVVSVVAGVVGVLPAASAAPAPVTGASSVPPAGPGPSAAAGEVSLVAAAGPAAAVEARGSATALGAPAFVAQPIVGMAATADGAGYWLVAADGGIFAYGTAPFHGSTGAIRLQRPIVDMATTPTGNGYWLVASDGGVFAFGDASFAGSLGGMRINRPIVSMAPTASGRGYWLVASDGGVFAFGDAAFHGSIPGLAEAGVVVAGITVVDMVARPQGDGYWLVDEHGGVYSFGAAPFLGTPAGLGGDRVVAAGVSTTGAGYWLASATGAVHGFGDAVVQGAVTVSTGRRVGGFAVRPDGSGYWVATVPGFVPASRGETGAKVTAIQQRLTDLGFWQGAVDGTYGGLTSQAVMAFQKVWGLPRTGTADPVTAALLATAPRPTARFGGGDRIEVDLTRQVLFVVRAGEVVHTLNVSTGSGIPYVERTRDGRLVSGDAITPTGRFRFNRELPNGWRISDLGELWRPKYFFLGFAIHGARSVPAYPASHGCVRVTTAAMDWLWASGLVPLGQEIVLYR
jgi:hypothetical protein